MNPQKTLSRKTFEILKYICGIEVTTQFGKKATIRNQIDKEGFRA